MEITKEFLQETPNLKYVVELIGERDFDFERKFIATLKSEFSWELGKYVYHMNIREPRAAAEIVQKLKFKFSVLGMGKTFAYAEEHIERLHMGDMRLDADFRRMLDTINSFLEKV